MATWTTVAPVRPRDEELPHKLRVILFAAAATVMVLALGWYGWDYYILDLQARVEHPMHPILRPSGTLGLKLGMFGVALFAVIFVYPLRKRWRWLASIGKTNHWLDYHAIVGLTAPIIVTYHAAFKAGGIAGWAYWIMVAVALSGFIGRYLYTQIPQTVHATEISAAELEAQNAALSEDLARQQIVKPEQLAALLDVPSSQDVRRMSLLTVLWTLFLLDLKRPFLVGRLRRSVLGGGASLMTLGGVLPSKNRDLEAVIANSRMQSRLRTKIAFLDRIRQMFHLWHVIHRPFSISFAAMIIVHIGVVIGLGYF